VNLPGDSSFGNAVHEAVHRLSSPVIKNIMGQHFNEGITQLYTDVLLKEVGLPQAEGHKYGVQKADAEQLESKVHRPLLAQAYFQVSTDAVSKIYVILQLIPNEQSLSKKPAEPDLLNAIRK